MLATVLLATGFSGAVAVSRAGPVVAQSDRCTIDVTIDSADTWRLDFSPRTDVAFVVFPEWTYRISGSGQDLIVTTVPVSGDGVEFVSAASLPPGEYAIEVESASTCSTSITYDGGSDDNAPPTADIECPFAANAGDTYVVSAEASDPDGDELSERWRTPDGLEVEGSSAEWLAVDAIEEFVFTVSDGENEAVEYRCEVRVPQFQLGTPTPPPATAVPTAPPATVAPATSVPATSVPTVAATPRPTPASEPTATPVDEAVPTEVPDPAFATNQLDVGPDEVTADDPQLRAGRLTYAHPIRLTVGEVDSIVVTLIATDLADVPTRGYDANNELIVPSDPNVLKIEIPVYGVIGPIELTLDLRGDALVLADDEQDPTRTISYAYKQLTQREWPIKAVQPGTATATIRSDGVGRALASDLLTEEELAAVDPADLELRLRFEIIAAERTDWLPIALWKWLLILPVLAVPVAFLHWTPSLRRERSDSQVPGPGSSPAVGQDLGLVLSGGGMRATAFAAGVAGYLLDSGAYSRLAQIASVSGGSFTNAWLAGFADRHRRPPARAEELSPLIRAIARRGLALERAAILFSGALVIGTIWIWLIVLSAAPKGLIGPAVALAASVVFAVLGWIIFTSVGVRGAVARWVPAFVDVSRNRTMRSLSDDPVEPAIDHVITSTATSSEHVHVSQHSALIDPPASELADPNGDRSMLGAPAGITVSQAVRASSAFPGLPKVVVKASDVGFGQRNGKLTLWDGGTIDNLGHIGATLAASEMGTEDENRFWLTRWKTIHGWFVVDASAIRDDAARRRRKAPSRILEALHLGLFADLAQLAGSSSSDTSRTSVHLAQRHFARENNGVYLHLEQSPFELCVEALVDGLTDTERARAIGVVRHIQGHRSLPGDYEAATPRAERALGLLVQLCSASRGSAQADWETAALDNPRVRTTLSSLGEDQVIDLVHHGWVLAMTKSVLDFGWPEPDTDALKRARFEALVADG